MITVGEILKKKRIEKNLSLEQVEKATKIRVKFLEAIEEDNYKTLPPSTFIKGFIRNYGTFLGLDAERLLAIFRRQYDEKNSKITFLEQEKPHFVFTPNHVLAVVILLITGLFVLYLSNEYRIYRSAPSIVISTPSEFETIPGNTIVVKGRTQPETAVTINNQKIEVKNDGSFSQEVNLLPGNNTIIIVATNKFDKTTEIKRNIKSQSP